MAHTPYTYQQALTFEVARDLLNTYVADCSEQIGLERAKTKPDEARIAQLIELQQQIVIERESMPMTDDAAMQAIVAKYRRPAVSAA